MRLSKWVCLFLLSLCVVLIAEGVARAQVNTADLSGEVTDPQGLAVPGAKVSVKNLATGAVRSATTDDSGRYRLVGLPPGRYELTIEGGKGLARLVNPEIVLTIGQSAEFDARLQIQKGAETVTVTEATELIETRRTAVAETVSRQRIDNLPINGRNYINFTLTTSQAQRDSAPSIGAAPTSGINFGGQRARSNQVSVDGADAGDNSVNGIRATVSQEAVQEFQIIISNYMPEFGRATGGVINIVTKGGGNDVHGNVFGFLRHKSLQARNPFSVAVDSAGNVTPVKQGFTRAQAGATIGGPIQKDKTFYFFSYETTRRQETGFNSIGGNNFGLVATTTPAVPGLTLLLTPQQAAFVNNPAVLTAPGGGVVAANVFLLAGSASSVALNGIDPGAIATARGVPSAPGARFPLPIDCSPPAIPCSAANLVPLPASYVALNSLRGNFPVKEGTSLWSARLDHQWNTRNNSFIRVSVSPSLVTGIEVGAQNQTLGQNAGSRTSLQQTRDLAIVGQHVTSFTNSLFNEARFQFARRGLHYGFSQLPGGSGLGVNITGFAFFGREPFSTVDRIERRFQWTDNMTWIKVNHTFKFGTDINLIQLRTSKTQIFELNFGGVINFGLLTASTFGLPSTVGGVAVPGFAALQSYGLGLPTSFIQGIGTSDRPFSNKAFAGFLQDSWKIHPRVTLNYGVRYDVELTPLFPAATAVNAAAEAAFGVVEGIPRDYNNIAPRAALAWDMRGNAKTVVRAGYGLFYDHPLLAVAFNSFTAEGAKSVQLISGGGTPTRAAFPTNPTALNAASIFQGVLNDPLGLTAFLASQQRFDPKNPNSVFVNQKFLTLGIPITILPFTLAVNKNFVYGYAQQGNLTIEQQLGHNYKFSVSYTYTHASHLNRPRDINATDPLRLATNFRNALAAGFNPSSPLSVVAPAANVAAGTSCGVTVVAPNALGVLSGCPGPLAGLNGQFLATAAFFNFFRPSGPNPSFAGLAGGYANQVALATLAGFQTGFPGVQVPLGGVDNQESTGSSIYHGLTVNFSKRFAKHFEFLSSYTWSHAIDDSTDLQTLLEPQEQRRPDLERSNSSFDQRHRWVTSAVMESPYKRTDTGFWRKFLADFTVAPLFEVASGRPFTVLTGTDFRLNLGANTGRPSVVSSGGVTSPFIPGSFSLPTTCDGAVQIPPLPVPVPPASVISPPVGCTGNLGRNTFVRPNFFQWDMRVARKFYFTERVNLEVIADMFNLFNRNNIADVNPLCDLSGGPGSQCRAGQPTASLDPRQFQFGLKINW
ncbi:MAG: TonB-dependent receptor [Acidobacteria bacterium]|nr:TonB-dependent receptor [Acidobacteriota bacterium]